MATNTELKTASVLAFERKIDPSDAVFYAGNWADQAKPDAWEAIANVEKSVRGTISNRMKGGENDPAKLDAKIEVANLQKVDVAALPPDKDTLKAQFTVRILGGTGTPNACNNAAYQTKLLSTIAGYAAKTEFAQLAQRYASNIANARFLWRNRMSAESVTVTVKHVKQGTAVATWTFDALSFTLRNFDVPAASKAAHAALAAVIQGALNGKGYALLEVTAYARMGAAQEVFPSQELVLDSKEKKSKFLYSVKNIAAMHSQKIGNALRTIDTWYPDEDAVGAIAVEPYGSVTALGKAYRQPAKKQDFYSLLDGWMIKDQVPSLDQQHYVVATLIRGGVFGASGKE